MSEAETNTTDAASIVDAVARAVIAGQPSKTAILLALMELTAQTLLSMGGDRDAALDAFAGAVRERLRQP